MFLIKKKKEMTEEDEFPLSAPPQAHFLHFVPKGSTPLLRRRSPCVSWQAFSCKKQNSLQSSKSDSELCAVTQGRPPLPAQRAGAGTCQHQWHPAGRVTLVFPHKRWELIRTLAGTLCFSLQNKLSKKARGDAELPRPSGCAPGGAARCLAVWSDPRGFWRDSWVPSQQRLDLGSLGPGELLLAASSVTFAQNIIIFSSPHPNSSERLSHLATRVPDDA